MYDLRPWSETSHIKKNQSVKEDRLEDLYMSFITLSSIDKDSSYKTEDRWEHIQCSTCNSEGNWHIYTINEY